jgi:hypothetical protein
MSFEEKDSDLKVGSNGIQASSGPAYGADALGPRSDVERTGGMEGYHDAGMSPTFVSQWPLTLTRQPSRLTDM